MRAPKQDALLPESASVEHLRCILLIWAVLIFGLGTVALLKPLWSKLKLIEKAIVVTVIIVIPIGIWDYCDSYSHIAQLTAWISSGRKMEDFFLQYNFHETWRGIGRIQLYVVAIGLNVIPGRLSVIRKWVKIGSGLFSIAGIVFSLPFSEKWFCLLFSISGYGYCLGTCLLAGRGLA